MNGKVILAYGFARRLGLMAAISAVRCAETIGTMLAEIDKD